MGLNDYVQDTEKAGEGLEKYVLDDTDNRSGTNLGLVQDIDPDNEAKVLGMSEQTGYSPDLVREDLDTIEKQQQAQRSKDIVSKSRGLKSFFTNVNNAAIAHDDAEALLSVEEAVSADNRITVEEDYTERNFWDKISQAFRAGKSNVEIAGLRARQLFGDESEELLKEIEEAKARRVISPEDEGFFEKVGTGVAEQLPILFGVGKSGIERGVEFGVVAGTGAAIAGQLGPQAATPEELATVPIATAAGFALGYKTGSALEIFGVEAGLAYDELLELKDEKGQPIDKDILRIAAAGIGTANAGLEFVAFSSLMKTIPGMKNIFGKITTEAAKDALQNPSTRRALLEAFKSYGGVVTTETLTEMGQEAVNILGAELAKRTSEVLEGTEFAGLDEKEALDRILESGAEGFYASVGLGLPGPTVSVTTEIVKATTAPKKSQEYKDSQTQINAAVNQTKLKERSQAKIKEFLETAGVGGEMFISPEGIEILFQTDPEAAQELLTKIGIDPEQASSSAQSGQTLTVKTSDVHAFLNEEEFNAIADDIKPSPNAYTAREISNQDSVAEVKRIADIQAASVEEEASFNQELDRIEDQVIETMSGMEQFEGLDVKEFAGAYTQKVEAFANRMAIEGRDRVAFVKKIDVGARRGIEGDFQQTEGVDPLSETDIAPYTLKFFSDKMLANKQGKHVKTGTIRQILNQKGVTAIEKDIIEEALASEQFQNKKSIPFDEFQTIVQGLLLPVEPIQSQSYADYGADQVRMDYDKAESIIYNTDIPHGVKGHFHDLFKSTSDKVEYEVVEVPQHPGMFVAIDKNRPDTQDPEELGQYVGTAGSKEIVESWVEDYNNRDPEELVAGMFGWARRWDKDNFRFIPEMQSDFYQKKDAKEAVTDIVINNPKTRKQKKLVKRLDVLAEEIEGFSDSIKSAYNRANEIIRDIRVTEEKLKNIRKSIIERENKASAFLKSKEDNESRNAEEAEYWRIQIVEGKKAEEIYEQDLAGYKAELKDIPEGDSTSWKQEYEKYFYAKKERADILNKEIPKSFTTLQKQFVAHRKNYGERILREEIRRAAKDGKEKLMVATPYTSAIVEGFIEGEGGDDLYEVTSGDRGNLEVGDEIYYLDDDYYIVETERGTITVAHERHVNVWDVEDFISGKIDDAWDETRHELPDSFDIEVFDESEIPEKEGRVLHRKDGKAYAYVVEHDEYPGVTADDIVKVLEEVVKNDVEDYMSEGDTYFEIPLRDIDDLFTDTIEESVRDRYEDPDEIIASLENHYDIVGVEDDTIYAVSKREDIEVLPKPGSMQSADPEGFDVEDLAPEHQTIVNKYEEHGKTLKKIKPDSYEIYTDESGYEWHSVGITEEDSKAPVQLFQAQKEIQRGSVRITDEKYLVSLFEDANLSTLFHETGHIFLNEMEQVVNSNQASKQFVKDYTSVLKWLGSKDGVLTTEQHEKFARGFEAYLLEGKSPNLALEGAFARFRRWLSEVYKSAKDLKVKLTKEVKGVFDRLLVAEADISDTAKAYGMTVKTKEELNALGVGDADQAYMKRLVDTAIVKAESAMLKDRAKRYKENIAKWREEAKTEVDNDIGQKFSDQLSKWDGVDRQELIDAYGSVVLDKLPKRVPPVFRAGGMTLEEAAFLGDFDSVDDMVITLQRTRPKKEAVQAILNERRAEHDSQFKAEDYLLQTKEYGDYLAILGNYYEGPVKDEEANVDPLTGAKTRSVFKPGKLKAAKTISREAFSKFVKKILDAKSVRDAIRHDRYLAAMKKAQATESRAVLAGDMAVAQKANEQVRLNYEMAGQAIKNRKLVEKIIRNAKRVSKSKTVEINHREGIRSIVQRFSLAEGIAPQKPENVDMAKLIEGGDFQDNFPASDFLLSGVSKNYKDLAFSEMKEVDSLIKYLTVRPDDQARLKSGVKVETAAYEAASETYGMKPKKIYEKFTLLRKMTDISRHYFARLDSLNFIMISKGGYKNVGSEGQRSDTEQYVIDPLIEAKDSEDKKSAELHDELEPFLTTMYKTIRDWNKQYGRKIVIDDAPTPALLKQDGQEGWWTGEQIFAIALNIGNESNFDRLTKGYPDLTMPTINKLLSLLNKNDWDAIQGLWDTINSLYPETDQVHVRINNFHMDKVEARPFKTKFGEYKGGYYPAVFDPSLSSTVAEFTEKDDLFARSEAIRQVPATKTGMTKQRKSGVSLPLKLSLSVATNHIRDAVHYITHAEAVRDADRITRHKAFSEEATRVLGKEVYEMVRPALKHIARPVRESVDPKTDRVVSWLRSSTTAFILAWNASVAAKQMFSSPSAAFDMGKVDYIKGFKVFANPSSNYQIMKELSPYMAQREKSMDRELQDMFNKMSPDQKVLWFGDKSVTFNDVRNFGFWPIRVVDMLTVMPIWDGAFNKKMKETEGDLEASIKYADDIVRRTQPSAQPLDLSHWQRAGGAIRFFSSFQTFTVGKYGQRQRLHYRAMRAGKITKSEYAWHMFTDAILPGLAMNLLFAALHGKDLDDEETYKEVGKETVKYITLTGLPIINQFFSSYGSALDSPISAGPDEVKKALVSGGNYIDELDDDSLNKLLWSLASIASFLSKVPVSRVASKAVKGVEQEEENIPGVKYLIPAPKK